MPNNYELIYSNVFAINGVLKSMLLDVPLDYRTVPKWEDIEAYKKLWDALSAFDKNGKPVSPTFPSMHLPTDRDLVKSTEHYFKLLFELYGPKAE